MNRVRVKICGITREEDLVKAISLRPDALGFVTGIPSSKRNVELEEVKNLLKLMPSNIKSVIVTVPSDEIDIERIISKLRPDALQIHGDYPLDNFFLKNKAPSLCLIKAVNGNSYQALENAEAAIDSFDAVLIDSLTSGKLGGTGLIHDWEMSREIRNAIFPKPLILAGGLTPENIRSAIDKVKPFAVDVSSGVELSPGVKDYHRMFSFIENVRNSLY
jgi:phosphoribosylanthranilate isomerase